MTTLGKERRTEWLFIFLLAIAIALRVAFLPFRWINPDEGPHLMDARLVLEGQTPVVDYASRQPVYVYTLAASLRIAGAHLYTGRFLSLGPNVLTAVILFILAGQIFGRREALFSATLFLFAPLSVIWSVVVKTEPLAVLLGALSMFSLWRSGQSSSRVLWVSSGALAALAFCVRQATLYLPLAVAVYLVWKYWSNPRRIVSCLLLYAGGYLAVVMLVFAFFVPRLGFAATLLSQLDPANIVMDRLARLFGLPIVEGAGAGRFSLRGLGQSTDMTVHYLKEAVNLSAFLIPGFLVALVTVVSQGIRSKLDVGKKELEGIVLGVAWILSASVLYAYHVASRGFFTQYATEIFVPLSLLTGWAATRLIAEVFPDSYFERLLFVLLGLFGGIAVLGRLLGWRFALVGWILAFTFWLLPIPWLGIWRDSRERRRNTVFFVMVGLVALAVWYLFRSVRIPGWISFVLTLSFACAIVGEAFLKPRGLAFRLMHFGLVATLAAWLVSAMFTGKRVGPKYECVWSPHTLRRVVRVLKKPQNSGAAVLSGAMIWTFEAGNPPYANVTHPTQFLQRDFTNFERQLRTEPPGIIIFDGYTHRKFAKHIETLDAVAAERYEPLLKAGGSRYPVEMLRLIRR